MSQAKHSAYESGETAHQNSENARFEAKFGLSWRDLEMNAKLNTVGSAVHEGVEKLEAFMQKVLELTKVVAIAVVCLFALVVVRPLFQSKS